ncbi:MAG: methyltransferase domain-containing protein [Caldilineaceae bacterium]|nr:methyltransferase domain-containing protein [Caldilineaceae bacterium]
MDEPARHPIDLHGERAARRGNPSFVWRAGQDRRLDLILRWARPNPSASLGRVLVDGCGVGMYVQALAPYAEAIYGIDIEAEHLELASRNAPQAQLQLAAAERLPYAENSFDTVLSHEVLEHVADDRAAIAEIVRVLKPGGRAVIFAPNRLYPFETHGHYWRGVYHFGNTPLINYLPNPVRNWLAPHVRAYWPTGLRSHFLGLAVRILHHTQIFPGYDNLIRRSPGLGRWLRRITYALEQSPFTLFGISHLLVVEKVSSDRS